MAEGLTDKMRCWNCRAWWSQRELPCAVREVRFDTNTVRHDDHVWVVPVSAVTEAIADIDAIENPWSFGAAAHSRTRDAYDDALRSVRALFTVEEETDG